MSIEPFVLSIVGVAILVVVLVSTYLKRFLDFFKKKRGSDRVGERWQIMSDPTLRGGDLVIFYRREGFGSANTLFRVEPDHPHFEYFSRLKNRDIIQVQRSPEGIRMTTFEPEYPPAA